MVFFMHGVVTLIHTYKGALLVGKVVPLIHTYKGALLVGFSFLVVFEFEPCLVMLRHHQGNGKMAMELVSPLLSMLMV